MVADSRDARAFRTAGRLNEPRPARVEWNFDGTPWQVNHQAVTVIRDMAPEFKKQEAGMESLFWGSRYARR